MTEGGAVSYSSNMLRRTFLQTLPAAAAAMTSAAAEEVPVKLGFDTYSLRAFKWKGTQLLDYAAGLKLDTIQFSALADYGPLEPQNLQKVKDRAQQLGISIDSGMGCICESAKAFNKNGPPARQQLIEGLKVSKAVGSKSMRCYMGSSEDRLGPLPIEAHMENTIKVFRSVRAEAMDLGVKIALENHSGDMQAREVKTIIEESGKDLVAACLDTGNPIWCVEDPFVTLETLAPVCGHHPCARFGRLRRRARRRRPMGGAGRRQCRSGALCARVPQAVPALVDATGDHHRPPAAHAAVSRSRFLESVSQDARLGIRPLRSAGQERSPVHGRNGDRGRGRQEARRDGRSAERAAAHRFGAELRIRQKEAERGRGVANLSSAADERR